MKQVNQAIQSIDEATRQQIAATRQVEQAANDLNSLSILLGRLTADGQYNARSARRGQAIAAQVKRMDKQQLIRRLMATFVGELDEHVAALNRDLLLLEKDPQPSNAADTYKQLFRTAHSLKGAARSVDAHPIERACHRLEDVFAASQKGELELRPEVYQVLFATADAIQDAGRRLRENCGLAGAPLEAVLADSRSLASGQMPVPRSETPAEAQPADSLAAPVPQSPASQQVVSNHRRTPAPVRRRSSWSHGVSILDPPCRRDPSTAAQQRSSGRGQIGLAARAER